MRPGVPIILASAVADGAAYGGSSSETSILHATGKSSLGAGALSVGDLIRVRLAGRVSTYTSGTLKLALKFGSVDVCNFAAMTMVVSLTNETFEAVIDYVIRALGSGTNANGLGIGRFTSYAAQGGSATLAPSWLMPQTAPAVGTGFDSTTSQIIDVTGTWSISNAANALTVHQSLVEWFPG